jgi:hypothetical protein
VRHGRAAAECAATTAPRAPLHHQDPFILDIWPVLAAQLAFFLTPDPAPQPTFLLLLLPVLLLLLLLQPPTPLGIPRQFRGKRTHQAPHRNFSLMFRNQGRLRQDLHSQDFCNSSRLRKSKARAESYASSLKPRVTAGDHSLCNHPRLVFRGLSWE